MNERVLYILTLFWNTIYYVAIIVLLQLTKGKDENTVLLQAVTKLKCKLVKYP